jgi:hypothetical protein
MTPADVEMTETEVINGDGEDEAPQPSLPMAPGEDQPSRF